MAITRSSKGGGNSRRPYTLSMLQFLVAAPFLVLAATVVVFYAGFSRGGGAEDGLAIAPTNAKDDARSSSLASTPWRSSHSAVLAVATNMHLDEYRIFVGSLRATGYSGRIILGISENAPSDVVEYLMSQAVTVHRYVRADGCTYDGYVGNEGRPIDMNDPPSGHGWQCPREYPDYKITHARFALYKDWIEGCPSCTDGIMLTDARDSFFQAGEFRPPPVLSSGLTTLELFLRTNIPTPSLLLHIDPFLTAVNLGMQHPILVFEEVTGTGLDNTHWLTDFPVKVSRKLVRTPFILLQCLSAF